MLTESGRVLSWGEDVDGLLGRKYDNTNFIEATHYSLCEPIATRRDMPGLVKNMSINKPIKKILVGERRVHAYLVNDDEKPAQPAWHNP